MIVKHLTKAFLLTCCQLTLIYCPHLCFALCLPPDRWFWNLYCTINNMIAKYIVLSLPHILDCLIFIRNAISIILLLQLIGILFFPGWLFGRMESINVAGVLQEVGDADSRAYTRSQGASWLFHYSLHIHIY